jgi:hypothetical protein
MNMKMKKIAGYLGFAVASFVGGATAHLLTDTPAAQAADPPGFAKEVRAEKFIVVDGQGKPRAVLGTLDKEPLIALYDDKNNPRLALTVRKEGTPSLSLYDKNGKPRMVCYVKGDDEAGIQLVAKDGKTAMVRLLAMADKAGETTSLKMYNPKTGKVAAAVISMPETGGAVGLFDKNGKPAWVAP